jgi:two-component system CheB/CheR fusion protein
MDAVIQGVVLTFVDVTRLTQAQAHQQVLISELNHRVQSMLMMVIGIAQESRELPEANLAFLETFTGRLRSIARSYDLLSAENWTENSLDVLVRAELAPLGLEGVNLSGPEIRLKPKAALSLGMIVHELATNACKHGSLSKLGGSLDISWSTRPSKAGVEVELSWSEIGGHRKPDLSEQGFGLKLIDREVTHNLDGRITVSGSSSGFAAKIVFPLV